MSRRPTATQRWVAVGVLLFAQFVVSLDMSVLNVAIADICSAVQPTSDQQLWILDIYSLVIAGLLVVASALGDRVGRKRVILSGFVLFGAASAFVLVAHTAAQVIAIRALLGVGGALIMPTTISLLRNVFDDPRERARAIAAWSAVMGLGMAAGPIIGGALLEFFGWQAAFLVNAPLMAAAAVAGAFAFPEVRVAEPGPWDAWGTVLSLAGMVALMWGIKHLAAVLAFDAPGVAAVLVGCAVLALFVRRCRRTPAPLVDFSLLERPPFLAGVVCALGSCFAMAALMYLLAQFFELIWGCTALEAGLLLVPLAASSFVVGLVAPNLGERFGWRNAMCGMLLTSAVGLFVMVAFGSALNVASVAAACVLVGVGTGSLALGSTLMMCEAPPEKASSAGVLDEISYDMGHVLGVAVLGSLASVVFRVGLNAEALTAAGLPAESVAAAKESLAVAMELAAESGSTLLAAQATEAFTCALVAACAGGGVAVLAATALVWHLVPADLQITETEA